MNEKDASMIGTTFRHIMDRQTIMMGALLDLLDDEEATKLYEKKWRKANRKFNKEIDSILEGAKNGK